MITDIKIKNGVVIGTIGGHVKVLVYDKYNTKTITVKNKGYKLGDGVTVIESNGKFKLK